MVLEIPKLEKQESVEFRGDGLNLKLPNIFRRRGTNFEEQVSKDDPEEDDKKRTGYFFSYQFDESFINNMFWTTSGDVAISGSTMILTGAAATTARLAGPSEMIDNITKIILKARIKINIVQPVDFCEFGIEINDSGVRKGAYFDFDTTAGSWIPEARDTAGTTTGTTITGITNNVFHTIKIEMKASSAKFFIDGVFREEITTNVLTDLDIGIFGSSNTGVGGTGIITIDWVTIEFDLDRVVD